MQVDHGGWGMITHMGVEVVKRMTTDLSNPESDHLTHNVAMPVPIFMGL